MQKFSVLNSSWLMQFFNKNIEKYCNTYECQGIASTPAHLGIQNKMEVFKIKILKMQKKCYTADDLCTIYNSD